MSNKNNNDFSEEMVDRSLLGAEKDLYKAKIREYTANTFTTSPTMAFNNVSMEPSKRSVLSRRRQLGDKVREIDVPGFWVHVESDATGVPRNPATVIEVNDDMTEWHIVGEDSIRMMERLPKVGVFFYLW